MLEIKQYTSQIYGREREICYEALTHAIIEATRAYHLLASQMQARDPAKLVAYFQSEYKGLRTRWAEYVNPGSVQWQEKTDVLAQAGSQEENKSSLPLLFVLSRSTADRVVPAHIGKGNAFFSTQYFKFSSLSETPWQTHPELMTNQTSGHLIIELSWHIKLTITGSKRMYHGKLKKCTELIENEHRTCQNMSDAAKAAPRGNFIALTLYTRKENVYKLSSGN